MSRLTPKQARERGATFQGIELAGEHRDLFLTADNRAQLYVVVALAGAIERQSLKHDQVLASSTVKAFEWPEVVRNDAGYRAMRWTVGHVPLSSDECDLVAAWLDGWQRGAA